MPPKPQGSASAAPVQHQCHEFVQYKVLNRDDIEYKGRVSSSDLNQPIAEYYKYHKRGEKEYDAVLAFVLKKDPAFLQKREFLENLSYPC